MAKKSDNVIAGLDLGTTKVCAIVGEVKDAGQVDIIGIGISPSHGLKKGVVVNIDSTVESIKKAVHEAELMAGVEINSVYVGISGGHIKGINSRGVAAIKKGSSGIARALGIATWIKPPASTPEPRRTRRRHRASNASPRSLWLPSGLSLRVED